MVRRFDDITDDQIRVLGHRNETAAVPDKERKGRWWIWVCIAACLVLLVLAMIFFMRPEAVTEDPEEELREAVYDPIPEQVQTQEEIMPLGAAVSDDTPAFTEHIKMVINDIPLDIYIPHNAIPELALGVPDIYDKSIVLTTQAADVRADNGKIVGAFVVKGEPLSWGLSKKGYCGIIDGQITVGVADNSPLFEEATEKGGYFFRQYPLVDNGKLCENEIKTKSIRKALCDRNGEIMVVMSETPESFHDFAQALVDMRVDNAIYLVGSTSYGYFRDKFDHFTQIYEKRRGGQKYENFIVWKRKTLRDPL